MKEETGSAVNITCRLKEIERLVNTFTKKSFRKTHETEGEGFRICYKEKNSLVFMLLVNSFLNLIDCRFSDHIK